jgi:hypothetical protein
MMMYLLSAVLLCAAAKTIYDSYVPQKSKEKLYIKALDIIIAVRESCKRCIIHPRIEVTLLDDGNQVLTSYVYTTENSFVHPKYSVLADKRVTFGEIQKMCEETDEHMMDVDSITNNFGMVVLMINEIRAVQIHELFDALAGPMKDFRYTTKRRTGKDPTHQGLGYNFDRSKHEEDDFIIPVQFRHTN